MKNSHIQWTDVCDNFRVINGFEAYCLGRNGSIWSRWGRGGRVRKIGDAWRLKSPETTRKGYHRVVLYSINGASRREFVHVLMLETFVGPKPEGCESCHEDGDKTNNTIKNLRWDSPVGNWQDRKRHGRGGEGIKQSQAKLTEDAVRNIRQARSIGVRLKELAEIHGVSMTKISQVALGKNWRHING